MQALELPLFSTYDSENKTTSPTEDLTEKNQSSLLLKPMEDALKGIFSQSGDENTVIKTRRILGEKAKDLSDDQVHCIATEFQFLVSAWLDEFEKDIFNGRH